MKRNYMAILATLVATLLTGSALAQPGTDADDSHDSRRGHGKGFAGSILRAADADLDNTVSASEWQDFLSAVDPAGSGEVEPSLLHQTVKRHQLVAQLGRRLDVDHDDLVTLTDLEELFVRLDHNEDGQLSAEDRPDREPRQGRRGSAGGRGPRGGGLVLGLADADQDDAVNAAEWREFVDGLSINADGGYDLGQLADLLIAQRAEGAPAGQRGRRGSPLDADQDGTLEIEDLQALHAELDSNADGTLDAEELPHRRGPRHGRRGGRRGPPARGFGG